MAIVAINVRRSVVVFIFNGRSYESIQIQSPAEECGRARTRMNSDTSDNPMCCGWRFAHSRVPQKLRAHVQIRPLRQRCHSKLELLTNASFRLSGDQEGTLSVPCPP